MKFIKLDNKIILNEKVNILKVIDNINKNGKKICFIVNNKNHLVGTISDGDIRRYLLLKKKINKETQAKDLCNKKFLFSETIELNQKIRNKILKEKIDYLPILEKKKLVSIVSTKNLKKHINPQPVLILAGGKGKRLRPATLKTPKPLINIGDRPILDHILLKLDRDGFQNIYLSTNYLKSKFKKYRNFRPGSSLNINLIEEEKYLGTAGSLYYLKKLKFENLLIINGDVYFEENLNKITKFHINNKNDITICTKNYENKIKYGVIKIKNNKFEKIKEKPKSKYLINLGIYVIKKDILQNLNKIKK